MKTVLVLGAGRSSSSLITYLLREAEKGGLSVLVADASIEAAWARVGNATNGKAVQLDLKDESSAHQLISSADVVVSLLPPQWHVRVAKICVEKKKHLLTASYVSSDMQALDADARTNGILLLNECGLDPGIDHMSAMQIIDRIRDQQGEIHSFESFTGGLIAPETDPENPWRYKFTWNPRNVVTAGQSTAKYIKDGELKYIPYQQLFKRISTIEISEHGSFEGYANRDSLAYRETYQLKNIKTLLRGTLRYQGFCSAWNIFVQLGCCDDSYQMHGPATHADFLNTFLPGGAEPVHEKVKKMFGLEDNSKEMECLTWSGFFTDEAVGLSEGTPAQFLEHILNKKWTLQQADKDMIVMVHRIGARIEGAEKIIQASLVVEGKDSIHTAMAKTVGLPLGIAAKLLIQEKIKLRGVAIPVFRELYEPVLRELQEEGIALLESEA